MRLSKMGSPRGAGKRTPENGDLIDCAMVLPISTCKLDAQNTPDAFKQAPTCFEGPWGRKIRLSGPGPENTV